MSIPDAVGSCTSHELILEADILEQNSVAGGGQCSCQRQGRWRQAVREARTQSVIHKARRENVEGCPGRRTEKSNREAAGCRVWGNRETNGIQKPWYNKRGLGCQEDQEMELKELVEALDRMHGEDHKAKLHKAWGTGAH